MSMRRAALMAIAIVGAGCDGVLQSATPGENGMARPPDFSDRKPAEKAAGLRSQRSQLSNAVSSAEGNSEELDEYMRNAPANNEESVEMRAFISRVMERLGRPVEHRFSCKGKLCKAELIVAPREAASLADIAVSADRELFFYMDHGDGSRLVVYATSPYTRLADVMAEHRASHWSRL